jgi:hypothetical protein
MQSGRGNALGQPQKPRLHICGQGRNFGGDGFI